MSPLDISLRLHRTSLFSKPRPACRISIRGCRNWRLVRRCPGYTAGRICVGEIELMKTHARVVVIGGGVVGVSTLYHLALKGWTDAVLLERSELTAGSTWHAAGLLPLFNMSYTVGQLHKYSVDLYKRLPAETGQDVSFHVTGNLRLATCRDRMDEYQKYCGTANTIGVPFQVIGPQQVRELWPLVDLGDGLGTPKLIDALYHPDDGHIAPAHLTLPLRNAPRSRGAGIH